MKLIFFYMVLNSFFQNERGVMVWEIGIVIQEFNKFIELILEK
jgi:hypothetical protein